MSWTGPEEIRGQLERLWERGRLLEARLRAERLFPLRLRTSRPGPGDLALRFDEVRAWIKALEAGSRAARGFGYEIEWSQVRNRQLGRNEVPAAVIVPSEEDALALIGKRRQAELVAVLAEKTRSAFPQLGGWLAEHPLLLLEHADRWERILAVLSWFRDHPRPGIYLRQLDIPGVDTKFVERRRELFADLLNRVLPEEAMDHSVSGAAGFEQRFGLKGKPAQVRFRILDERLRIGGLTDLATTDQEFARLDLGARRVFVTENAINGLAFPPVPESIVIFGLGYRVDRLATIDWLKERRLYYWGDIDTHGFAILDRLRGSFGEARSFLMDRATLLAHRELWGREEERAENPLANLTDAERALYSDLRLDRLGDHLRLEQERVGFGWVRAALEELLRED